MKKKHIVKISCYHFAFDSVTTATNLLAALSKAEQVDYDYVSESGKIYCPLKDGERTCEFSLDLNQKYMPPKPEPKALSLPKPKRGAILCICEKSYVAPRESCPSCGRNFSESHNRTHQNPTSKNLRLL